MKMYLVWYDNGEPWDDHYTHLEAVCSSHERAVEWIAEHTQGLAFEYDDSSGRWKHPEGYRDMLTLNDFYYIEVMDAI